MIKYNINTDKEFLERFAEASNQIRLLGGLFQNLGVQATAEEVAEWESNADNTLEEIKHLLDEASQRIW
ncbi:hypothetical protein GRF59_14735 [Paenibacillus sp. HJL G12]|uniref:Uncharacterized protein n=1 Tax=Paenibacillus dendrobii TaxID=2691084 RepID=A0A7X3IJJ6_9BACL|nr:hypothetical protein [Paenibacillus dendrobii]MWV44875.1 hypothetical protein [Paenibacillus dendrobii]